VKGIVDGVEKIMEIEECGSSSYVGFVRKNSHTLKEYVM